MDAVTDTVRVEDLETEPVGEDVGDNEIEGISKNVNCVNGLNVNP
jgi:hypothetical protein